MTRSPRIFLSVIFTKRIGLLFLLTLVLAYHLVSQPAQADANVLATVNGKPITREEVISAVPQAEHNPVLLKQSLQRYINTVLIYDDAMHQHLMRLGENLGVPQNELHVWMLHAAEQRWLASHSITQSMIKSQYQHFLASLPAEEWRLRVIMVTHRKSAQTVLREIKHGESFSVLAAQHPKSPNAALGGELGWVNPDKLQASIRQAVAQLMPLEVIGPVNVPQGLAIVQLLGKRKTPKPSLEQTTTSIKEHLQQLSLEEYATTLRQHAKIIYSSNSSY